MLFPKESNIRRHAPERVVLNPGSKLFAFDTNVADLMNSELCLSSHNERAAKDGGVSVCEPSLLTPAERHKLVFEWNDTQMDYPRDRCVHQLFEEQVMRTPDVTAVVFDDQQLSYAELNARANNVAERLVELGVGAESLVGICVERSLNMVAALLGIMKAGGAYVPLDPRYPSDRLSFMLQDSGLKVLVTQQSIRSKLSEHTRELVCVDLDEVDKKGAGNCTESVKPDNLAYVIYTSGSTGKPKGVQICHRSLVNFLTSMRARPGLEAKDTLLAVTTISFDIAALELYLPLIVGARVVIVSRETAADGNQLREHLEEVAPTAMQATPATWTLLLEAGWRGSKDLKVLCGGEALPSGLAGKLLTRASSVWNMYGPTETTVWSTSAQILSADAPITIGRPIGNTKVYVLDSQLRPVRPGIAGELYIGGAGVARGYLHRPDLTAEKFIPSPFGEEEWNNRLYKTGDLARYRADGQIECLGRIDHQVKVRGFRIELGEIEAVLSSHARIRQSVVVAQQDGSLETRLVAYLVADKGAAVSIEELREFIAQKLPEYMLPSHFEFLESLPLTPNGKVDRKALPAPRGPRAAPRNDYLGPRNAVESRLADIWRSVLDLERVGIREDFFDLGGHSLLVAKLLARIDRAFGKKLSMAAIFEAPTIERQAAMLCDKLTFSNSPILIPVQPLGSKPPLFCFGFRGGPVFLPLAKHLGPDQPLISVDVTLLEANELSTPYTMEDIAAVVMKRIREWQPHGPYCFLGFCSGGLMALEIATQFIANGHKVALLALLEPQTPPVLDGHWNRFRFDLLSERLRFHVGNLHKLKFEEARFYVWDRGKTLFHYLRSAFSGPPRWRPRTTDGRLRNIEEILNVAAYTYRPSGFPGPVTLFQATHRAPGRERDHQCWSELTTGLKVQQIPGYSNWLVQYLMEPNVGILANRLSTCLPQN